MIECFDSKHLSVDCFQWKPSSCGQDMPGQSSYDEKREKRGQALHLTQRSGRIGLDFLGLKVVEESGLPWLKHRNDWSTVNYDISAVFRVVKAYINGVNCGA